MNSEYLLTCQCGTEILVRTSQAGGTVRCQCGYEVSIPTLRDLRQLPMTSTTAAASTTRQNWQTSNGVLFAAGVPITLICLAIFLFALYLRGYLDVSKPDLGELQSAYLHDLDTLTLTQSWSFWLSVRAMKLDDRPTPLYLINRDRAVQLLGFMIVSSVGIAIGTGCIVAAFSLSPKVRR